MKLYTKTGDGGTTTLVSGERISKASARIEAYGTLDELMAHIGYLYDILPTNEIFDIYREELLEILSRTMDCAALMATTDLTIAKLPQVTIEHITQIEHWVDQMMEGLPVLRNFTLPVGSVVVSSAHICRTVARRAERACVSVSETEEIPKTVLKYINRLSDYFYAFARKANYLLGGQEILWR